MDSLYDLYQAFGDPGDEDTGYQRVFSYVARDILTDASTQVRSQPPSCLLL